MTIYFPVFLHLDVLPIVLYDESLFSIRALHYYQFGEYMENFNVYEGLQDHRNTKLPFTTLLQALGLKIFGINELGIRLPVSFVFIGTVCYTCYDAFKHLDNIYIGYIFGIILVSSTGFVDFHMLRTGDQDVPFACYLFLGLLFFHRYVSTYSWKPLAVFTFFMIAALWTKNLVAGIILPGLIAYLIYRNALLRTLKDYRVYLSLLCIIGSFVGIVAWLNEQYPGFWNRMWHYELFGRFNRTIEEHQGGFLFYFNELFQNWQNPFSYLLPIGIAGIFDKNMNSRYRNLIVLMSCALLSYGLIMSFSETKTFWYAAPLFPMSAMVGALVLIHFWEQYVANANKSLKVACIIAGLFITAFPYVQIIQSVYFPDPIFKDDKYGTFIETVSHWHPELKDFTLVDNNFGTSAYFYKVKFNAMNKGYQIDYQRSIDFREGQLVMTCLNNVFRPLSEQYDYKLLHEGEDCRLVRIKKKK